MRISSSSNKVPSFLVAYKKLVNTYNSMFKEIKKNYDLLSLVGDELYNIVLKHIPTIRPKAKRNERLDFGDCCALHDSDCSTDIYGDFSRYELVLSLQPIREAKDDNDYDKRAEFIDDNNRVQKKISTQQQEEIIKEVEDYAKINSISCSCDFYIVNDNAFFTIIIDLEKRSHVSENNVLVDLYEESLEKKV